MPDLGIIRSLLFVPGSRMDRVDKAIATQADMVIIDLEDAVAQKQKAQARTDVVVKLATVKPGRVIVRINGPETPQFADDLAAVMHENLAGILAPMMESRSHIQKLHDAMTAAEKQKGLSAGSVPLIAQIETALAVENISSIARAGAQTGRLHTVAFGAADYTMDLGIEMTLDGSELFHARSRLPIACRAAGLAAPIDTPFMIDLKDLEALEADTLRSKQLGFSGKLCIHPNQLETVNRLFSPNPKEVAIARKIMAAFHDAEAAGQAAIQVDGKFVDPPVMKRAEKLVKLAEALDM